ncbi:protein EFR3 homolog cmp44E-like [Planococcus citri]|uniref:protein EFR3 homolog cmp44E-like n=1 Tax=Planococcus citri TaxID=170843 RepID=UPI0031FA1CEF
MCFSCFSQLRPRYKRLVDDIFPTLPQDGLVKSNMEKLTFYALSSPEKLDRIGEYLYQKASRDITRRREGYVKIAMEAMDQLLVACHSQTLNLFVESFLRIVQKLLECPEPELQILATQSFVRFANIEEDTPSYHRRYDFFVSKFSSMCHNNNQNLQIRERIRLAGIKGLQGVIRKTVSDDLVENIWEPVHMDKIIPSLLYNMQNPRYKAEEECLSDHADTNELLNCNEHEEKDPAVLAESCFRELVGRASFGHVKSVIRPVLRHFDLHNLWVNKSFAIHCFRLIMFSIQSQYLYTVIESLMIHLDENSKLPSKIRTNVADVLSKIIAVAAGESVGPTVLEIINSLLTHLRTSVTRQSANNISEFIDGDEKNYQEALIVALGEFAAHLPDYQKIEIMMFIMSKIAYSKSTAGFSKVDDRIQHICLKSLLMVCSKYSSIHMTATLPQSFLDPLLRCSQAVDPQVRLLVQNVLHMLFDRHGNGSKLSKPTLEFSGLNITYEKCSRTDSIFMRKHSPELYASLCESLEHKNNSIDNVEAIYKTMALLCIELTSEETISDFFHAIFNIQDLALTNDFLPHVLKYQLHTIVVCLLSLVAYIHSIPTLQEYVNTIIENRKEAKALHLMPDLCMHYEILPEFALPNGVLIDQAQLIECLNQAGIDITKLASEGAAALGKHNVPLVHRHSWVENAPVSSLTDFSFIECNSDASSPCIERKYPNEDLTFEAMKRVLTESSEKQREEEAARNTKLFEQYKLSSFNELVEISTRKEGDTLQYKLGEIFNKLNVDGIRSPSKNECEPNECYKPLLETLFPECFVY